MKHYEKLPKSLPVPEFLDEKILQAAADFSAHRRARRVRTPLLFGGAAAAAAALFISTVMLIPGKTSPAKTPVKAAQSTISEKPQPETADWNILDQESFVLSTELNQYNSWAEESWI